MSALVPILLLLAGGADGPVEKRLQGLVASEPVSSGQATIVFLTTRESVATVAETALATDLRGNVLEEDGRTYLRISNPGRKARLLLAGTVFAAGDAEVAVARDVLLPPGFGALVPAEARGPAVKAVGLEPKGLLAADVTGGLLLGSPAFPDAEAFVPVLDDGAVVARRHAYETRFGGGARGSRGQTVGAIFLLGGRPAVAHIYANEEMFQGALPNLLGSLAMTKRAPKPPPTDGRRGGDRRQRAIDWLKDAVLAGGSWGASCGAGLQFVSADPLDRTVTHALVDENQVVVHMAVYQIVSWPAGIGSVDTGGVPPPPPDKRKDPPPGLRERRPRPTPESERRDSLKPPPEPRADLKDASPSDA